MPSVIEQLEREWDRLAVERRAAARLGKACAVAGNATELASLEAYVRAAGPADADRVLVALAGPASAGGRLEARVLLQLLLPGVRRLARRWWALGARDEREAAAVAAVWGRICSYPVDRRPAKVAANILMDAEKELRKASAVKRQCWEDLPPDHPAPVSEPCPGEELAELLREAVASGMLSASDAEIVAALRIGGVRVAEVVATRGTSERTVRRRCRAAELALARVAAA